MPSPEDITTYGTVPAKDLLNDALGGRGLVYVSDTSVTTAPTGYVFKAIMVLTDATFTTLTPTVDAPVTGTLTGVSFGTGLWLFGKYSMFTLTSGSVIAYLGSVQ